MSNTAALSEFEALSFAKRYFDSWGRVLPKDVSLSIVTGGFCSQLYLCADKSAQAIPGQFLIRFQGGKVLENSDEVKFFDPTMEAVLFLIHGQLGFGPKLYGVFPGGRLEEYIPSRNLTQLDLDSNPVIRRQISSKLGRFHTMELPLPKPEFVHPSLDLFIKYYDQYDTISGRMQFQELLRASGIESGWIDAIDFRTEFTWLANRISVVGGRKVHSLNDMNKLNCLIRHSPDKLNEIVTLVDYELGGWNYRGYDIGCHFNQYVADFGKVGFLSGANYPELSVRKEFVRSYVDVIKDIYDDFDPAGIDSVDHILMEAELHGMLQAIYFVIYVLKPKKSDSPLANPTIFYDFASLAKVLLKLYTYCKDYFISKYC